MTTVEFSRLTRGTGPHHAHGWGVSLLCHALGVWCAVLLMAEIDKPVLPIPFQWEVAMVEPPAPVEPTPVQPPQPTPPPQVRPVERVVEPQPLNKPIVPVQQQVVDVPTPVEVETVQPIEQITQDVVTPVKTVMEHSPQQTVENRTVVAHAVSPTQETLVETVVEQAVAQPTVSTVVERSTPPTVESAPHAKRPEAVEHEPPVVESVPAAVEQRVVERRQVHFRQTQADYGWLRSLLYGRIEQLKRYPTIAKTNHWEGKVVIQAVIRDDGTVIGLQIAESSGKAVLDQEAMEVMRKISPVPLKHPLGARQITILVPISYRLDG